MSRHLLLIENEWNCVAQLGVGAFETIGGEVVNVSLVGATRLRPDIANSFLAMDVGAASKPELKAEALRADVPLLSNQNAQLNNPDARITTSTAGNTALLSIFSDFGKGSVTGDGNHYLKVFWELFAMGGGYRYWLNSPDMHKPWSGREHVVMWGLAGPDFRGELGHMIRGDRMWGKRGVAVCKMSEMGACIYDGELFDDNVGVLLPLAKSNLAAIFAFAESEDYRVAIRKIDQAIKVTAATLVKVPFDLAHWQAVAAEKYPNGLPTPHSSDPTQWLFNGHPKGSDQPLHVAVARLLGYRWPRQTGSSFPDCPALGPDGLEEFADDDGIVCLPPLNREQPAAARLRQILAAALGTFDEGALIASAGLKGSKSKNLEDWLRDEFFEQHAKLFHDRPFVWHIWDGRPDGFHALVHYHRLDHATLTKLAYSYLGNWIQQQDADAKADKPGAAVRLGAAQKLQLKLAAILEGEAPLDLFVRWKPLAEQAQGFHPDLNDGVRQNIRPFLLAGDVGKKGAGLFRAVPLSLKDKDRGNEPMRPKQDYPWFWCEEEPGTDPVGGKELVGSRWNDVHLTLARKRASRG